MTIDEIKQVLLWCVGINYAVLILWFLVFLYAHDWLYRVHSRWFRLSVENFDIFNYLAIAIYKIVVVVFFLVPLIALHLVTG